MSAASGREDHASGIHGLVSVAETERQAVFENQERLVMAVVDVFSGPTVAGAELSLATGSADQASVSTTAAPHTTIWTAYTMEFITRMMVAWMPFAPR